MQRCCLLVIFIVLFTNISICDAEWINSSELAELKIKNDVALLPYFADYAEQRALYQSLIQKISSTEDVDSELEGSWKLVYMCETNKLDNQYREIRCDRIMGPDITVTFSRETSWNKTWQKNNDNGEYKLLHYFKKFGVKIVLWPDENEPDKCSARTWYEQGRLIIDQQLPRSSFGIEGKINAVFGLINSDVVGTCEKITDPDNVVCIGTSTLKPKKAFINIYEKPNEPASIIPPGGCDFSRKQNH